MNEQPPVPSHESRIHGCLLGGALGDALGASGGSAAGTDGTGVLSGRTRMTLYTVDGLLEALEWANSGVAADANACLWLAYLRWLGTQGMSLPEAAPFQPPRWIDGHGLPRESRSPDPDSVAALVTGEMGTVQRPLNPDSRGGGALLRSAPFGLVPHLDAAAVYKLSADAAALTHGHPSARQSAGVLSLTIRALALGAGLAEAAGEAVTHLAGAPLPRGEDADTGVLETLTAVLRAPEISAASAGGADAAGLLAVALSAVLTTAPDATQDGNDPETGRTHFRAAVTAAAERADDAAGAAALAGYLLGAHYGAAALPVDWLAELEAPEPEAVALVKGMAERLAAVTGA